MTYLYMYRLAHDSGFAPCVDNGLFTLACCKGGQIRNGKPCKAGLRYNIGSKKKCDYTKDDVYILGIYKSMFLYLAKITDVKTMREYYSGLSKGRKDDIYIFTSGKLQRNSRFRDKKIHTEKLEIERDLAGEYVLFSDDFIYLGEDACPIELVNEYAPKHQETKVYNDDLANIIIAECCKSDKNTTHKPHYPLIQKCGGIKK